MKTTIKRCQSNSYILQTLVWDFIENPTWLESGPNIDIEEIKGKVIKVKATIRESDIHLVNFVALEETLKTHAKKVYPISPSIIKEKRARKYEFKRGDTPETKVIEFVKKSALTEDQKNFVIEMNKKIMAGEI